eukprot:6135150-Prymnesium_polylepis.1
MGLALGELRPEGLGWFKREAEGLAGKGANMAAQRSRVHAGMARGRWHGTHLAQPCAPRRAARRRPRARARFARHHRTHSQPVHRKRRLFRSRQHWRAAAAVAAAAVAATAAVAAAAVTAAAVVAAGGIAVPTTIIATAASASAVAAFAADTAASLAARLTAARHLAATLGRFGHLARRGNHAQHGALSPQLRRHAQHRLMVRQECVRRRLAALRHA